MSPIVVARVSRIDIDDPSTESESYRIAVGNLRVNSGASTITVTADNEVRVNPWPLESLLTHAYEELECDTVGALDLRIGELVFSMWYDDEALLNGTPVVNRLATKLCGLQGPLRAAIHGTVLLTGAPDGVGDTQPLTQAQAQALLEHLQDLASAPMPPLFR